MQFDCNSNSYRIYHRVRFITRFSLYTYIGIDMCNGRKERCVGCQGRCTYYNSRIVNGFHLYCAYSQEFAVIYFGH